MQANGKFDVEPNKRNRQTENREEHELEAATVVRPQCRQSAPVQAWRGDAVVHT
jgi:hypothetical protein